MGEQLCLLGIGDFKPRKPVLRDLRTPRARGEHQRRRGRPGVFRDGVFYVCAEPHGARGQLTGWMPECMGRAVQAPGYHGCTCYSWSAAEGEAAAEISWTGSCPHKLRRASSRTLPRRCDG